jgi:magnesium transporter
VTITNVREGQRKDASPRRTTPSTGGEDGSAGADDTLRVASLVGGEVSEGTGIDALDAALAAGGTTWIDVTSPAPSTVEAITHRLTLHVLIAEDIIEGNQRAKIEVTDELIHIVLFAIRFTDDVDLDEIDIVLGERFLLTVHPPTWDPRAIKRVHERLGEILGRGADHLLWAIVDSLVDDYFPCLDGMGDLIDGLEDAIIAGARPAELDRLFHLKRDLLVLRHAVSPVRDIFNQLTNRDLALIDPGEVLWFRDVYDHLVRLTDEIDTYRELVSGTVDVYLSTVNNNLSLIMKRLTAITVVLAGIGAIAGIFGMSEAGAAFSGTEARGFWLVTAAAVVLALALLAFLRRIDWI